MPKFLHKKMQHQKSAKITKNTISCWCLAFLGSRPLPQTDPSQGPFLTVFAMFYAHRALFKKEPFFCFRGGRRHFTRRMPCGPICPASDSLCIAGFKTGWRLWPPTRGATQKSKLEAFKSNQNQPYLIQLGEGLPTVFPPSFSRFCCPVFFLPQPYQIQLVHITL